MQKSLLSFGKLLTSKSDEFVFSDNFMKVRDLKNDEETEFDKY